MANRYSYRNQTFRTDAQIELQQRVERHMRETGHYVYETAKHRVLELDPALDRRLQEEPKRRTPR